jgi:protein-tyrosine phosphatase
MTTAKDRSVGVLFVCLGNICRSPLAEGVFRELVRQAGVENRFRIDSAGTSNYHTGEPPDARTVQVAKRRGIVLEHAARQVSSADLEAFDFVIVMDRENLRKLDRVRGNGLHRAEIRLLRSFDPESSADLEVPDPYFGGPRGFEDVHEMVERSCRGLLAYIRENRM